MELWIEVFKFVVCTLAIVAIAKYILVNVLRNLAEALNLKPKVVGNIAGIATSVPELLTISLSSLTGLVSAGIFNVISSNIINFIQYIFAIFLNKNGKTLKNKALRIDILLAVITIIIPFIVIRFHLEENIWLVPIFLLLFFIFYFVNSRMHQFYLKPYEEKIEEEIAKEEKWKKGKKNLIMKYTIYILLIGILLFFIGNFLSDALENLCNIFGIPQALIGIILGFATSLPELITFFEAQKFHKKQDEMVGVVEATNNLLTSNVLNLFIIQSIGILLYLYL